MGEVLTVKNLKKYFVVGHKDFLKLKPIYLRAVDGVNLSLNEGETLGLVGESGCGKSTLARTIIRLYEPTEGKINLMGIDISKLSTKELRPKRRYIQMIFQDPYASLNPRMTVGDIISEPLIVFRKSGQLQITKKEIKEKVKYLLNVVGLSSNHINRYPHEFSGGQRQRIGIARALALNPKIILCDEPVSALDVSIQSQIINLLQELQEKFGLTYLFIAHDLAVVKHISDRVAVMYLGKIVEIADYKDIYNNPLHPYTEALLSAIPIPDPQKEKNRKRIILEGDVPSPDKEFVGCRFYERCRYKQPICQQKEPVLKHAGNNHYVACHYPLQ